MAKQYQYGTNTRIVCGGFPGEVLYPSGDNYVSSTSDSGDITQEYVFYNSVYASMSRASEVRISVTDHYNVSFDSNNRMNVAVTSTINWVRIGTGGGSINCHLRLSRYKGGPVVYDLWYNSSANTTYQVGRNIGTYNFTVTPGQEWSSGTFFIRSNFYGHDNDGCTQYVDEMTSGLVFKNTQAWIWDNPVVSNVSCGPNGGNGKLTANVVYNFGPGPNTAKSDISTSSSFASIVKSNTSSGNVDWDITGLASNTRYYTRITASNGGKSAIQSCNFVSLCRNSLSNATATNYSTATVRLSVEYGGQVYDPNTTIWVKPCSGGNWTQKGSSSTKTTANITITGLEENTCYQIQARTTTTAGTYTGNTITLNTPERRAANSRYTNFDTHIDPDTFDTSAKICYHYEGNATPIWVTTYYRVKGDFDPTWTEAKDDNGVARVQFNTQSGDYCVNAIDLFPNYTEYETYMKVETDESTWTSQISTFLTPLLPQPEVHTCENLDYLLELICQVLEALKHGNKTIYANPSTKELCDPYSENPTFASMWSRILRFDHAVACILCHMVESVLKSGNSEQYYAGETGWTYLATEITEGVQEIVQSGATYDAIDSLIHSVWHFHETLSYLVATSDDLDDLEDVENGDVALVTDENYFYNYNGSTWSRGEQYEPDNFSVHHINKQSDTALGLVLADSAWYYFEGSWNSLDVDTKVLNDRLTELENNPPITKQSNSEDNMSIIDVTADYHFDQLPDERIICFITEDIN